MTQIPEDAEMMAGMRARAQGKSLVDNPHLKTESLPKNTGKTVEGWQHKYDKWELGWRLEDAVRSP